jgi:hypothetical protein
MSRRTRIILGLVTLGLLLVSGIMVLQSGKHDASNPATLITAVQRFLRIRRDPSVADWKTPISFYGVVVDQNGKPVPDVTVNLEWNDTSLSGTSQREVKTDSQGKFSLTRVKGKVLGISLKKSSYSRFTNQEMIFEFADATSSMYYRPNSNAPVVFKLFKHGPKTYGLLERVFKIEMNHAKDTNLFDIFPPTVRDIGPVVVYCHTNAADPNTRRMSWTASIRIEGAKIIEAADEFATLAPETGYAEMLTVTQDTDDPWTDVFEKTVYFKSDAKPLYGKLWVRFKVDGSLIRFRYLVNPKGQGELE